MNIYHKCPEFENEDFLLRRVTKEDCQDLLDVYSDKNALPFFNSDGCNGDNFYYNTKEKMQAAIDFWKEAYENGWFVRLAIVDKSIQKAIGTIEICTRVSDDTFNGKAILRVDVKSSYEIENKLYTIFSIIYSKIPEIIECNGTITKASLYAIERVKAIQKLGFIKSEDYLIGGNNGYAYDGYWVLVN